MIKKNLKSIVLSGIVLLLPVLAGVILWKRLPDEIAVHFNSHGQADNWCSKPTAVFLLPLALAVMHFFFILMTALDPKNKNIEGKPFGIVLWICPLISVLTSGVMYAYSLDIRFKIGTVFMLFFGLMFIAIGNYLPKCRQNYTLGIRLPWTLSDEDNWNSTHRLAGKIWVAGGAAIILLSFTGTFRLFAAVLAVMVIIPAVYSYTYYQKHKTS